MSDTFSKCIDEKDVRHNFEARKKHVRHVFKANEEKRCQTRFFRWVKKVSDTFCIPQDWKKCLTQILREGKNGQTQFWMTQRKKMSDTFLNVWKKVSDTISTRIGVWHFFKRFQLQKVSDHFSKPGKKSNITLENVSDTFSRKKRIRSFLGN